MTILPIQWKYCCYKTFFFFCINSFLVKKSLTTGVPFFIRFRGNIMNLDFKKLLIIFLVGRHDTIRVYQRTRVALYSKICKVVCITFIKWISEIKIRSGMLPGTTLFFFSSLNEIWLDGIPEDSFPATLLRFTGTFCPAKKKHGLQDENLLTTKTCSNSA